MESNSITIPQMLQKLDDKYKRQNEIIVIVKKLKVEWEQLEEDCELLQNMIIYASNKQDRENKY